MCRGGLLVFLIFPIFNFTSAEIPGSIPNRNYTSYIKTILFHQEGNDLSSPILNLLDQNRLQLSFDDLEAGEKNYSYTLIHCTAEWLPSDLFQFDYLQGFHEDQISRWSYSFNTRTGYTHYELLFPNENMKILKSGNYIVKVFRDFDTSQVCFTRRFMVYEARVGISGTVRPATFAAGRKSQQEIDFTVNHKGFDLPDPFAQAKVVLMQNDRWDRVITGLKPLFLRDVELIYDLDQENLFPGGNEFRFFDTRKSNYRAERTADISIEPAPGEQGDSAALFYHFYIEPDERQSFKAYYSTKPDLNGKFRITTFDVRQGSAETEADYVFVHFFLDYPVHREDGNFFIGGALTEWSADSTCRMKYNFTKRGYEATLFIKQGYYNYEYLFLSSEPGGVPDDTFVEGSHAETENGYTILFYARAFGSRYDQLVGIYFLNSRW